MADRLKEILAKVKEWWNKYTSRQKTMIVGGVLACVLGLVLFIVIISRPKYLILKENETQAQTVELIGILDSNNIAHKEDAYNLKVMVQAKDMQAAELALAAAGYKPDSWGINDALTGSMTTTASDTAKRYKLYLEKKLEENFEAMPIIKTANVTFEIPEQDGTLLAQQQDSSAYIQLELNDALTSAQTKALARAAATALGNKNTTNITIVDYDANLLFAGEDSDSVSGMAGSYQELQKQAQTLVENDVKKVLLGTHQYNNIAVGSYLSMDFAKYQETIKEYYANDDRTEGMIASQDLYEAENTSGTGGVPGTDSNNEATYLSPDYENSESSQTESSTQYLPNERSRYTESAIGAVNRSGSSISVSAIRYRQIYEDDVRSQGLLDGDMTWEQYKLANSSDVKIEVDPDFYTLVATATGFPRENVTIIAYETPVFYDRESVSISATTIMSIILFVLILGLLAFVVLRTLAANRKEEPEEEEISVESLLESTPADELGDIDVETKSETRKLIEKFVDENPEAAAALLRNWLNEDWG